MKSLTVTANYDKYEYTCISTVHVGVMCSHRGVEMWKCGNYVGGFSFIKVKVHLYFIFPHKHTQKNKLIRFVMRLMLKH